MFELQFPKKEGIKCAPFFFLSSHKSCTLILRKLLICAKKFRNNFLDVAYQTDDQLCHGLRTPNETFFKFPKYFVPLDRISCEIFYGIFVSNLWSKEYFANLPCLFFTSFSFAKFQQDWKTIILDIL